LISVTETLVEAAGHGALVSCGVSTVGVWRFGFFGNRTRVAGLRTISSASIASIRGFLRSRNACSVTQAEPLSR
jgi:hypothetical protein